MGRVPKNPNTQPDPRVFYLPEPEIFFTNPKNPKIQDFIYLKTRKKPEKRLGNPTRTRHLATRPITVTVCRQNSWLLRNTIINIIFIKINKLKLKTILRHVKVRSSEFFTCIIGKKYLLKNSLKNGHFSLRCKV